MKNKFSVILALLAMIVVLPAIAKSNNDQSGMSKISLQLQAEEWVTTSTANVSIAIDAALDRFGVAKMRSEIMNKLAKIASADWHLTRFDQTSNAAGLEQVQVTAEARLQESALANLRAIAKSLSKPGFNIKVANIDFTPTPDEIENVRISLRNKIYNQAKAEIMRLNKIYPEQNYFLYSINFMPTAVPMPAANMQYMARGAIAASDSSVAGRAGLMVSNKVQVAAVAEIASGVNKASKLLERDNLSKN